MEDKIQNFRLIVLNDDYLSNELKKSNSVEEIYGLYKRTTKGKCLSKDEFYKCITEILSKNIDEKSLNIIAGGSIVPKKAMASLLAATSAFGVSSLGAHAGNYGKKSLENNVSLSKKVKNFISGRPFKIGAGIFSAGSVITIGTLLFLALNESNSKSQSSTESNFPNNPKNTVVTTNSKQKSSESEILVNNPLKPKTQSPLKQKYYSEYTKFSLINSANDYFQKEVLQKVIPKIHFTEGNLVYIKADAIVNAANSNLANGGGVTGAIFSFLGADELTNITSNWKKQYNGSKGLDVGQAAYTSLESIKNDKKFCYKGVIHTVGPNLSGKKISSDFLERSGYMDQLKSCYKESVKLCFDNNLYSVAFPSISTGIFGFPPSAAMVCAMQGIVEGIAEKVKENPENINYIPEIYLVRYKSLNSEASSEEKESYDKMAEALGCDYEKFPLYRFEQKS